jgi:hypothetical protein
MSAPVSLKDLLRLTFSEPVTWLSGKPEEGYNINWVTSALSEAQVGDLLILSREEVEPQTIVVAKKRGVAAVLLLGRHLVR